MARCSGLRSHKLGHSAGSGVTHSKAHSKISSSTLSGGVRVEGEWAADSGTPLSGWFWAGLAAAHGSSEWAIVAICPFVGGQAGGRRSGAVRDAARGSCHPSAPLTWWRRQSQRGREHRRCPGRQWWSGPAGTCPCRGGRSAAAKLNRRRRRRRQVEISAAPVQAFLAVRHTHIALAGRLERGATRGGGRGRSRPPHCCCTAGGPSAGALTPAAVRPRGTPSRRAPGRPWRPPTGRPGREPSWRRFGSMSKLVMLLAATGGD